ncbi:flavodoxin family protein [Clostridium neuense]|uniref:Flavodoxin family protein n=1 Tax=Clostridium neuense TaxID=1728934 RepID=A0ABW8TBE4_9CLOT
MKRIIIYESVHHGNTEKVSNAMAEVLKADLIKSKDVNMDNLNNYDLIGFGSGIYYGKFHKNILELLKKIKPVNKQKAFVFSTSGQGKEQYNDSIKKELTEKDFEIIGNFACKGFDTYGPLKLIGGIAKGRPNDEDISKAREFAMKLSLYE